MFGFTKGCKVNPHGTVSQVKKKNIPENRKPQCSLTTWLLHAALWCCDLSLSTYRSGSSFFTVVFYPKRVKLETLPIYLYSQKKSCNKYPSSHLLVHGTFSVAISSHCGSQPISGVRDECKGFQPKLCVCECVCSRVLVKYKKDRECFWHRHQKGDRECPRFQPNFFYSFIEIQFACRENSCIYSVSRYFGVVPASQCSNFTHLVFGCSAWWVWSYSPTWDQTNVPCVGSVKSQPLDPQESLECVLVTQSWPTLCDAMDCRPPGSSVRGFLQARIGEWLVISFSRASSRPRGWIGVSCISGRFFTVWATRKAQGSHQPPSSFRTFSEPLKPTFGPSATVPHFCSPPTPPLPGNH